MGTGSSTNIPKFCFFLYTYVFHPKSASMLLPFYRDSGIFIYLQITLMRIARYQFCRQAQQNIDTISTADENSRVKWKCL